MGALNLCRWGNKLSNKMFKGREYVLKHIRLKHAARVEQERDRLFDEAWFDRQAMSLLNSRSKSAEAQWKLCTWCFAIDALDWTIVVEGVPNMRRI